MNGLTPKQQRFVEEYLVDLNATQAAIRAGYSKKTAEFQASRLLRNVKVQKAISKAREALSKKTMRGIEEWLQDLRETTQKAIDAGVLKETFRGLELEGKHLGAFVIRAEVSGVNGGPIQTQQVKDLTDEELEEELKKHGIEPTAIFSAQRGKGKGSA